jgi:predicted O-methyltransferase YrrM
MSDGADQSYEAYFVGKELTTDWTSRNYRLWADLLATRRNDPLRVLEIGSWEGRSALFFLNYLPHCTIVCIDTFGGCVEHKRWPLWQRIWQLKPIEKRFDRNLAPFGTRVRKIKERSLRALGQMGIERQRFDVIYVDGSHLAIDVYRDGLLAFPLLAPGGVIIFDDYKRRAGPEMHRPSIGIDALLATAGQNFDEIFRGHQLILCKRSDKALAT